MHRLTRRLSCHAHDHLRGIHVRIERCKARKLAPVQARVLPLTILVGKLHLVFSIARLSRAQLTTVGAHHSVRPFPSAGVSTRLRAQFPGATKTEARKIVINVAASILGAAVLKHLRSAQHRALIATNRPGPKGGPPDSAAARQQTQAFKLVRVEDRSRRTAR
jgi:hypothetical protein